MNDQLARSLFMDYLYDEISDENREKLEHYLDQHPDLKKELDELQKTRSLLQKMPEEQPAQKLLMVEPRKRTFSQWWSDAKTLLPQSGIARTGLAIAASLVLLLFIASAAKLHISYDNEGLSLGMGYTPVVQEGISQDQAQALLQQIRQENAAMLADFAESMQEQNQQQLQQVVGYFEQQRINDLQLIDQGITQVHENNIYRWQQTNEYLGDLLQNVSLQRNNN